MWVTVRRPIGTVEEIELPEDVYIEIGDILNDGSVVLDLQYPDDIDEDFYVIEGYEEEEMD